MTKIPGSGSESGSGSISQRHGSADPYPHQNVMGQEHCFKMLFFCTGVPGPDPGAVHAAGVPGDQVLYSSGRTPGSYHPPFAGLGASHPPSLLARGSLPGMEI
jgi:hypothetical protein